MYITVNNKQKQPRYNHHPQSQNQFQNLSPIPSVDLDMSRRASIEEALKITEENSNQVDHYDNDSYTVPKM